MKIAFRVSPLHEEICITKGEILTEARPQLAAAAKMMHFKITLGTLMICKVIEGNLGEKVLGCSHGAPLMLSSQFPSARHKERFNDMFHSAEPYGPSAHFLREALQCAIPFTYILWAR